MQNIESFLLETKLGFVFLGVNLHFIHSVVFGLAALQKRLRDCQPTGAP